MYVDRVLTEILDEFPDIQVEKIDIVTNPSRAWKDGIRMIPALRNGDRTLSGFLPKENEIRDFLEKTV